MGFGSRVGDTGAGLLRLQPWWGELGWFFGIIEGENLDAVIEITRRPSSFLALPGSTLFTFCLAAILGGFMKSPDQEKVRSLTWRGVVFGNGKSKV